METVRGRRLSFTSRNLPTARSFSFGVIASFIRGCLREKRCGKLARARIAAQLGGPASRPFASSAADTAALRGATFPQMRRLAAGSSQSFEDRGLGSVAFVKILQRSRLRTRPHVGTGAAQR